MLAESAWDLWRAFPTAAPKVIDGLKDFWSHQSGSAGSAVLILDALSLRELPLIVAAAKKTGVEPVRIEVRGSQVPTETDPVLAESTLFGHVRGAFTGADKDRAGLIASAQGKVLFLDEVQDLPKTVQRKLVRVLQDRQRRYSPVGSDEERTSDFEMVCASNRTLAELQEVLDPDLFDRLAHLVVSIPPLRDCREDLHDDWQEVWRELQLEPSRNQDAPWVTPIAHALANDPLPGNFRDLQRLALLCMAWNVSVHGPRSVSTAIQEWKAARSTPGPAASSRFYLGTREQRTRTFQRDLARWAKEQYSTWTKAAGELRCNEKTLRDDAAQSAPGD